MTDLSVAAIRCVDLSKRFDGIAALDRFDLSLPLGRIVAIVGPNGAGKTTLFNVLTGFLRPDRGNCSLFGNDLGGLRPHQIARMGAARTFQEMLLIRQVSVLENVILARPIITGESVMTALLRPRWRPLEADNARAAMAALEFVGLESQSSNLAGELSYGQQKLLSLACCLATEAKLLLLDEPIAGVYPELAEQILERLRRTRRNDRLVVFIEHDLAAVREIADEVVVMDDGHVLAQGRPEEVLQRPDVMEAYIA